MIFNNEVSKKEKKMRLQNAVFPKIGICTEKELFFRTNKLASVDIENSKLYLEKMGKIETDTYFNGMSIGKWKRYTEIKDLYLSLKFKGKIKVTISLHRLYYSYEVLKESKLESEEISEIIIPLEFWDTLEDGMLSFDIVALTESEIYNFSYCTNTEPINDVKLGISITHFNRQQYVLSAIDRLKKDLLENPDFKEKVFLYVVDNSKNLPEIEGVEIIQNENLGGSGGFTRGLMQLKENGTFTHCLFMDDDASCEIESIKRTVRLLEFAKDKKTAVAGAMLRESVKFMQFENGARFEGVCIANKDGLDLRGVWNLLENEVEERIDYAGWWYFAFPIAEVKHYAFPYFVRGDDSGFSLAHNFKIITLNGIASWQEDFALKNGPLPHYLDTRYHIMHYLHGLVKGRKKDVIRVMHKMFLRNLLTYQYETALSTILAVEDVCKGSDFWRNNVDMMKKRPEILSGVQCEKLIDIPFELSSQAIKKSSMEITEEKKNEKRESKIRRIMSLITLNGHLVPRIFFHKAIVQQHKGYGGALKEVYLYEKVLYLHQPTNKGFIVEHSKKKFFKLLLRYIRTVISFSLKYNKLKNEYQSTYDELTSKEFWKKQFDN